MGFAASVGEITPGDPCATGWYVGYVMTDAHIRYKGQSHDTHYDSRDEAEAKLKEIMTFLPEQRFAAWLHNPSDAEYPTVGGTVTEAKPAVQEVVAATEKAAAEAGPFIGGTVVDTGQTIE